VPIPEFVGLEVGEVQKTFHAAGLGCKKVSAPSAQYKKNLVIAAALEDGTEVFANDGNPHFHPYRLQVR
jgi:beta-lactam-binding protein with PASTA domain